MKLNEMITVEDETIAPRLVLYGVHGIGKTTFGSKLPKPVFVRTEDGMKGHLFKDVARLPLCDKIEDVVNQLQMLLSQEHEFKSVVVDSVDWMELLVHKMMAERANVKDVSDIGYQAGYKGAATAMLSILNLLSEINRRRNMLICLLGHSQITKFNSPDHEPYDRYGLSLHKNCEPLVYEWADCCLFVNYKTFTKKVDESFGKDKYQAVGIGERVMYSEERPAFHAKNRYGLPSEMKFDWAELANFMFNKRVEE